MIQQPLNPLDVLQPHHLAFVDALVEGKTLYEAAAAAGSKATNKNSLNSTGFTWKCRPDVKAALEYLGFRGGRRGRRPKTRTEAEPIQQGDIDDALQPDRPRPLAASAEGLAELLYEELRRRGGTLEIHTNRSWPHANKDTKALLVDSMRQVLDVFFLEAGHAGIDVPTRCGGLR